MSVLSRLAHFQIGPPHRRDEIPNQELARDLAARKNRASREAGIREIAENLWNADAAIQADCIKVLYEIGAIEPALIAEYVGDFLKLLHSKNNRLVWGAMTALAAIAELKAADIYAHRALVLHTIETGSVITKDNGLKTLAIVAATAPARRQTLFPILLRYLETCRPKDVPQYAEKILVAVTTSNRADVKRMLEKRMTDMSGAQATRVKKILREIEKR